MYNLTIPFSLAKGFGASKGFSSSVRLELPKRRHPPEPGFTGLFVPHWTLIWAAIFRNKSKNLPSNLKIDTPNHHISIDLPFPRLQIFDLLPFPESNPIWKKQSPCRQVAERAGSGCPAMHAKLLKPNIHGRNPQISSRYPHLPSCAANQTEGF